MAPFASPGFQDSLRNQRAWLVLALGLTAFTLWTAWVQLRGFDVGAVSVPVVEYWVHGVQPDWSWVPFVHPPLYSVFMNAMDWYSGAWGRPPHAVILVQAALIHAALVFGITWVARSWMSLPFAVATALLITFVPASIRPFEQYPIAKLLVTMSVLAIVSFARKGTLSAAVAAVAVTFMTVEMNLLCWFALTGLLLVLLVLLPERRKVLAFAALATVCLFLSTTYPGLYDALAFKRDPSRGMAELGGTLSLGWSNPTLLLPLALWFIPSVRYRDPHGAGIGGAVLGFTVAVLFMQYFELADGQPFPDSYHYFVIIDPLMVLGSVLALQATFRVSNQPWTRQLLLLCCATLVVIQLLYYLRGQSHVWLNLHWFWILGLPS